MASQGPNSTGTGADDVSSGTSAWTNPTNIQVSDAAYAMFTGGIGATFVDTTIKLIIGGTISGTNKSTGATVPSVLAYRSFGASNDLWGLTPTVANINASNFGVAYQSTTSAAVLSHFLSATNFGFSIPVGATIDGILVEIQNFYDGIRRNEVDHIRMTVFYTSGGASFIAQGNPRLTQAIRRAGSY